MNSRAFFLPPGTVLIHEGRRLRFVAHLGGWVLHLVDEADESGGPYRVVMGGSTEFVMPTVSWLLTEFTAGRLFDPNEPAPAEIREARFMGLDRAACVARDPKSAHRHDWGMAALKAELPKTEGKVAKWIRENPVSAKPGDPEEARRMFAHLPSARSVIRWMGWLTNGGMRIGACVNASGRLPGQSQLPDAADLVVHKAAMTYSADTRVASFDDAAALGTRWWFERQSEGADVGASPPTAETYRLRIRSLECKTTRALRSGNHSANRFYDASGEPVPVERPFERVFMDGTEFEHACVYSDDWDIPSSKMKAVHAMDAFTQYVFPNEVFTGPYRSEKGIQAALNIMVPPEVTPEEIEANPFAGLICGLPSDLMGDNDRCLIPPGIVPAAVTLMSSVELAPIYLHDAKAKLENYHRFLKAKLKGVKGRILGPSRLADPRYDAIGSSEVTRAQYAQMIENARQEWNHKPRSNFGGKSPHQLMVEYITAVGPRLIDPGETRRHFARTPSRKVVLTNDGITYDNIHYRWNRSGINELLGNNYRNTPHALRIDGTAKILVTIRVYDGNLDMIEVLDATTGKYHTMWSTNPRYTGGLSRWEHTQYCQMIRAGKDGAVSEGERLIDKSRRLVAFDQEMPKAEFRARENMAALMEAEDVRRASGARVSNPDFAKMAEYGIPTAIGGENRLDTPQPPPQPAPSGRKRRPKAPKRSDDYGMASTYDGDLQTTERDADDGNVAPLSIWDDEEDGYDIFNPALHTDSNNRNSEDD